MRAVILGPGYNAQYDIVVHREGCQHLKRAKEKALFEAHPWVVDAASRIEIVHVVYPPSDFDYAPGSDEERGYAEGIAFVNCTRNLPS